MINKNYELEMFVFYLALHNGFVAFASNLCDKNIQ